ncbi:hypothetical protein K7X08_017998 [Anisodus acutangulus]|uniref:Uncharacterized protein n=1 Tax=Anisodus acutangulus TaxID=402998 RepID=A0A9Q1R8Q7_9SOLA|nr:hypothetical protein K7X08_017998 [Anisodus acutangulus]
MLAAIDAAIEDGVDVISFSIGINITNFWSEVVALCGFTATQKCTLVSCSAGNAGPLPGSVVNGAPWLLTVGASTTDRKLRATIRLGDGNELDGESVFQPKDFSETLPLIFPRSNISDQAAACCSAESLKNIDVKGKTVLCISGGKITRIDKGHFVKDAGGAEMILMNSESQGFTILADPQVLPAAHVSYADGLKIKSYIDSTSNPLATFLFKGTIFGDDHAPAVAGFSGRGPNLASPGILKPDITGPGVNILAAWPTSIENNTDTKSTFNISSGTSMPCPHVSGIATLVKGAHPDWSPAAIKSAIMMTADIVNLGGKPIEDERGVPADLFATGAGHVNTLRASDPGLIYDIQPEDYVPYLCGLNYSNRAVNSISLSSFTAIQNGILVSTTAGNTGPEHGTVANGAPWLLTVGARTTDRKLRAIVLLRNGDEIDGESAFQPEDFSQTLLPLVYSGMKTSDLMAPFCTAESLKNVDVKRKNVFCEAGGKIERLDKGHLDFGDDHAPAVTAFSSRGPFPESPDILKPDVIGPEWSPAAIKSAIMTTADLVNLGNNPIEDERGLRPDFFATGAGHVNPLRANDPGLIYDIQPNDYIPYL